MCDSALNTKKKESKGESSMHPSIKTMALVVAMFSFVVASVTDSVTATENPCLDDIKRLCGDVKPGQGRIQACLEEHKNEISPECKAKVSQAAEDVRDKLVEVQKACSGDVDRFCKGVAVGEGRILKCLAEHKDELSQECKNAMGKK
jgi:hypothetical protein